MTDPNSQKDNPNDPKGSKGSEKVERGKGGKGKSYVHSPLTPAKNYVSSGYSKNYPSEKKNAKSKPDKTPKVTRGNPSREDDPNKKST